MQCSNHQETEAVDRCAGCAEPFCGDCLCEIHGQKYCGACKVLAIKDGLDFDEDPTLPCREANEALAFAIASMFCCGIILSPLALVKAAEARKLIAADARLQGSGKVTVAVIIAVIALIFSILNIIQRAGAVRGH